MARPAVITTVPEAPDLERHRRMIAYAIMMLIRVGCFIGMIFAHPWWWQVLLGIGAVVLPYLAVTRANVPYAPRRVPVERPTHGELPPSGE